MCSSRSSTSSCHGDSWVKRAPGTRTLPVAPGTVGMEHILTARCAAGNGALSLPAAVGGLTRVTVRLDQDPAARCYTPWNTMESYFPPHPPGERYDSAAHP